MWIKQDRLNWGQMRLELEGLLGLTRAEKLVYFVTNQKQGRRL